MIQLGIVKVLLVEDDEDDYVITRDLLGEVQGAQFKVEWISEYNNALHTMSLNQHDICLVDYRLGAKTGVDLLRAAIERGCQAPIILLTGAREHEVDLEAMQAGAADYLVKTQLQANALGRSVRYALQRKRAAALAAFEQARLAACGAEIGLALTRRDTLGAILERCSRAMVQYLNAALAQISTFDPRTQSFEPLATVGSAVKNSQPNNPPHPRLDLAWLTHGKPILLRNLISDPRYPDKALVQNSGWASYAAYPLVLEEK